MTRSPDIVFIAEYLKDVLYFAVVRQGRVLKDSTAAHYFTIDDQLIYENYYSDFGPLNLGCVYKYCMMLDEKLKQHVKNQVVIVHYTSIDPKKKANAAFLIGCYGVIYLNLPPKDALKPLIANGQIYRPFQDATQGESIYKISILDCLLAIAKARSLGFFNFQDFNYDEYERLRSIQCGDLNWIVPGKFLAFIGPVAMDKRAVNLYHPPEIYIDYFLENDVKIVIRLNKRLYDSSVFSNVGITHYDLFFTDGSCPPRHILMKFLAISEVSNGAVAVHCKAGLGRTGSLIGCYLIKHYRMTAREAIGWMRICRPGSVIGHQQEWLEHLEAWLIKQGNLYRKNMYQNMDKLPKHQYGVYSIAEKSQSRDLVIMNKSPSPPPPIQRKNKSQISSPVRPHASRIGEASQSPIKKEQFEWHVTQRHPIHYSQTQNMLQKRVINDSGSAVSRSSLSRRSGAGEPRPARSLNRGHYIRTSPERVIIDPKESGKNKAKFYPIPTFATHGPVIKTVTDAKNFLMRSSIYNQDRRHLNSAITVTPQYSSRITNFLTERSARDEISRFTPMNLNTGSIQQQQRRRLGRSPSPPVSRMTLEQTRATNTPSHTPVENNLVKDSKVTIREALSRLKLSSAHNGSTGAASLGARREAPVPPLAPSVRSDERPLATQGDMLNSIKLQRRFRESLRGETFNIQYNKNNVTLSTASRDKSAIRPVNSKCSSLAKTTKSGQSRILSPTRGSSSKEMVPNTTSRNFFRSPRPVSPCRRSMQPSFY